MSNSSSNSSRRSSTGSLTNTMLPTRSSPTISRSSTQAHVNPSGFEPIRPSAYQPSSVWANCRPVLGAGRLGGGQIIIPPRANPLQNRHWPWNLGPEVPAGYVLPPIPPVANPPLQSGYSPASSKLRPEVSAGNEGRTIPPRAYPPPPYGSGGSFSRPQSDDPIKVSKLNAFNKLVENVLGDVTQVDEMFNTQAELRQDKKKGLEQQLQRISKNTDELEALLREVKKLRTRNLESVGVDAFSKQVLECIVSDLAIDDVIYLLDKAVEEGAIPFDLYLKNVRTLSRKQFYHRATATKVGASQMQAQAPLLNHQHRMI